MPTYGIYIAVNDAEVLDKLRKPNQTFTQMCASMIHDKADAVRAQFTADGTPKVPQYERQ